MKNNIFAGGSESIPGPGSRTVPSGMSIKSLIGKAK